jgi:subtilisin family serine protease
VRRRSFALRQAGLAEVCVPSRPRRSVGIALIDGSVDTAHPAFNRCHIISRGNSQSTVAADHATFNASILVGHPAGDDAGSSLAICGDAPLFNYAVITDELLHYASATERVAATLATAVRAALDEGCRVILLGLELRRPESRAWQPLRDSLRYAATSGAAVVVPAGNRANAHDMTSTWADALTVASLDWRAHPSVFSSHVAQNRNAIFAPGEDIPGARRGGGFTLRSGSSFAAAIATGAFALAMKAAPGVALAAVAGALCPPPRRVLDGAAFFGTYFRRSQQGEQHAFGNA